MRVLCRLRQLRPEYQVFSSADAVSLLPGSLGIGGAPARTTSWPSNATSPHAARKLSRSLPTPGGVPSRRRRGTAVKPSSTTADAWSGAQAGPGRFRPLPLSGGLRPVILPAQPDAQHAGPGSSRQHQLLEGWFSRFKPKTCLARGRDESGSLQLRTADGACHGLRQAHGTCPTHGRCR